MFVFSSTASSSSSMIAFMFRVYNYQNKDDMGLLLGVNWNIPLAKLEITDEHVGYAQFGEVVRGTYTSGTKGVRTPVAIKKVLSKK